MAFFKFQDIDDNQNNLFNLLPMQYINDPDQINIRIGEDVYIIGRSTGFTVGRLGSLQSTFRSNVLEVDGEIVTRPNCTTYEDHIQIFWNDDSCRFTSSMDCGSVYYVKRGPKYHPIGIHRISIC